MKRSKTILLTSHCIFNQNTVVYDEARSLGAIPSVIQWIEEKGYGVLQLPCPEFTYLGLDRKPMTYEEYDNEPYRAHCRKILQPVMEQLQEYVRAGYRLVGIVGIESSPSCDFRRGVFMEELEKLLKTYHIPLEKRWYVPNDAQPLFDGEKHFIQ